jgi:hypothetical protein
MNRESGYEERSPKHLQATLFNLDPEVVFHTNDVKLNSSILFLKKMLIRNNSLFSTAKREVSLLEKNIQEKDGELRHLHKQLTDMARDKHTEIVKLRLEVQLFK